MIWVGNVQWKVLFPMVGNGIPVAMRIDVLRNGQNEVLTTQDTMETDTQNMNAIQTLWLISDKCDLVKILWPNLRCN